MKILYLSHHWMNNSHHSKYSGFQRMVVYAAREHKVTLVTWGKEDADYTDEHGIRVITIKGSTRDFLFLKRIGISRKGSKMADAFDAVHALYSDCTFFLKARTYTVTFHVLPGIATYPSWKQKIFLFLKYNLLQKRAMRRAKNIVCVSTNLLSRIPVKYSNKAQFIPHGIDTAFWDPALSVNEKSLGKNTVLSVGSHGLDRTYLKKLIGSNPEFHFVMVGLGEKLEEFSNIEYLNKISDERLRDLYHQAVMMIRPLRFSTANNSILEAMSMGVTILASRIPGITDYLAETNCIFIDTLSTDSLNSVAERRLDSYSVREIALRVFSWPVVLDAYLKLYKQKS